MAAKHQPHAPMQTPELSMSDSENAYSSDEEEMPLTREKLDHWLRDAHYYVITEGGKDSESIYAQRIHNINKNIQEISTYRYDCNQNLYRHVKQKIDHVLREYEDFMGVDLGVEDDEGSDSVDVVAEEPLDSSPVTPTATSALDTLERTGKKDHDFKRTYLYGGLNEQPEIWYQKASASLPFPETFRMAEWESLRIDWDLANTGDMKNSEPVTSNGVSFHDPRLTHHDNRPRFETGSKYKLPAVNSVDMAKVTDYATVDRLHKVVAIFNQHDDTKNDSGDFEYAPRVSLERLEVGSQITQGATVIDDVREAVNASPTRRRPDIGSSKGSSDLTISSSLHDETEQSESGDPETPDNEDVGVLIAIVPSVSDSKQTGKPTPSTPMRETHGVSPAIRRIKAATESSIRSSNLPQSPHTATKTVHPQLATNISISATGSSGRSRKNKLSASPLSNAFTATEKRKRPAVDTVEEAVQLKNKTAIAPAERRRIKSAQPSTPSIALTSSGLHTPSSAPAVIPASARSGSLSAGKKMRKIRTRHDYEERVTPERYREIMRERGNFTAQGHEGVPRGVTRSGLIRKK